jgi:hypothetical protein
MLYLQQGWNNMNPKHVCRNLALSATRLLCQINMALKVAMGKFYK